MFPAYKQHPTEGKELSETSCMPFLFEVLVKLDQNASNLLRRDVRLVQLGIDCHKDYLCRFLEVIDQAIARTFAFSNISLILNIL